MKALKKFFNHDLTLKVTTILTLLCSFGTILACNKIIKESVNLRVIVFELILFAVMTFVLYLAYQKHDKNVQKCLMGSILTMVLMYWLTLISNEGLIHYYAMMTMISLLIFITHVVINQDHHSNPDIIVLNQILFCIFIIGYLVEMVLQFVRNGFVVNTFFVLFTGLTFVFGSLAIICIEQKCDYFREQRENTEMYNKKGKRVY